MTGMERVKAQPGEGAQGEDDAALRRAGRGEHAVVGRAARAALMETHVFMAVRSGATQVPTEVSATVRRHRAAERHVLRRMVTAACAGGVHGRAKRSVRRWRAAPGQTRSEERTRGYAVSTQARAAAARCAAVCTAKRGEPIRVEARTGSEWRGKCRHQAATFITGMPS